MIRSSITTGPLAGVTVWQRRTADRPAVRIGRALLLLVLALCWLAFAPMRASAAGVDLMLTPWEGFTTSDAEPFGIVGNPASLASLDNYVIRAQRISPGTSDLPDGELYVYAEPDNGIGSGQLAYVTIQQDDRSAKQYMYSGAWRGRDSAVGFSLKYIMVDNMPAPGAGLTTWAVDVGYRGQWTNWLTAGLVAQNVLLLSGDVDREFLPPTVAAGLAVNISEIFVVAADYLVTDLHNPRDGAYRYALEGRFGQLLARIGQRRFVSGDYVYTFAGIGYQVKMVRLDATVGQDDAGHVFALGFSLYF